MRTHISLNVRSLKDSIKFYQTIFNQAPQKSSATYAKFDLKNPSLNFSLLEAGNNRQPSQVNHFGIEVSSESEVKEWQDRLEKLNISITPEENTDCCYARQDKIWFRDPDENAWEVFYVHEQLPVEAAEPPKKQQDASCSLASGCC